MKHVDAMRVSALCGLLLAAAVVHAAAVLKCGNHEIKHTAANAKEAREISMRKGCRDWDVVSVTASTDIRSIQQDVSVLNHALERWDLQTEAADLRRKEPEMKQESDER